LVTGGLDTVRSQQKTGSSQSCLALLSTVGNVVLEKKCKAFGGLNKLVGGRDAARGQ